MNTREFSSCCLQNTFSNEFDTDLQARKLDRGDMMDTKSRKVYKETSNFLLDVVKMLWNEKETTDVVSIKIAADMMGIFLDSGTRTVL